MACHRCEHAYGYSEKISFAILSSVKLCREDRVERHDGLIKLDEYRPSRAGFPELYR